MLSETLIQVLTTTTCVSLKEAQGPGTTPSHSFHPTCAALGVQLYELQIVSSSVCSFSKAYSAFVSTRLEEEVEQDV